MTDPSLAPELVAEDRARDLEYYRSLAGERTAVSRPAARARGLLTKEMAAARSESARDSEAEETALAVEVQSPEPRESDPLAHLRAARLGFAVVVILVLYGLWIRGKRRK